MTPVPASKKFWIFNGSVEQYPSVLSNDSVHAGRGCTSCHGGDDSANSRELAHANGFAAIATAETCNGCHSGIVASSADGLHTTLGGYNTILMQRGFDMSDPDAAERFEQQCTKCHTAVGTGESASTACGQCHVSVPATAGGGLIEGHAFNATPSMDNNCTACHGSRVKDEYYGLNNELLERNQAAFAEGSAWADFHLEPDVHKTAGLTCMECHSNGSGDEMHGVGHPLPDQGDRYDVSSSPECTDCHGGAQDTGFAGISLHSTGHLDSMSCQICHAQPYKNCFSCHTDVTPEGLGFYRINGEDPTLTDRRIADETAAPDALMTFRAGLNPRFGEEGMKQYAVLRHVPVDKDVFQYSGDNVQDFIIPPTDGDPGTLDMGSLSTWKYATPHTIVRSTPITASCNNCHGTDYSKFWLTDPVQAAEGWVPEQSEYLQGEQDANTGITVDAPLPQ